MKKFDFVAELLAHGFHDDTKLEAVELSRQTGFEGVVLSRDFTKVIESVWSGRRDGRGNHNLSSIFGGL